MQVLHASMIVELTEDPRQVFGTVADVTKAWHTMLETIGLEVEASITISETRAKPGPKRKPRLAPVQESAA